MRKGGSRTGKARAARSRAADGWTASKEARFLEVLATTCNVTLAAKTAGVASSTIYKRRAKDATFRDGWAEAIAQGYARLEIETLERAINGTMRTIVHKDGSEETRVEYPDRVALALLRMHRDTAETPARQQREEGEWTPEEVDELRRKIFDKLVRLRAQVQAGPLLLTKAGDGGEVASASKGAGSCEGAGEGNGDGEAAA